MAPKGSSPRRRKDAKSTSHRGHRGTQRKKFSFLNFLCDTLCLSVAYCFSSRLRAFASLILPQKLRTVPRFPIMPPLGNLYVEWLAGKESCSWVSARGSLLLRSQRAAVSRAFRRPDCWHKSSRNLSLRNRPRLHLRQARPFKPTRVGFSFNLNSSAVGRMGIPA